MTSWLARFLASTPAQPVAPKKTALDNDIDAALQVLLTYTLKYPTTPITNGLINLIAYTVTDEPQRTVASVMATHEELSMEKKREWNRDGDGWINTIEKRTVKNALVLGKLLLDQQLPFDAKSKAAVIQLAKEDHPNLTLGDLKRAIEAYQPPPTTPSSARGL